MDVAVELTKCEEAADRIAFKAEMLLLNDAELVITELLAARADALRSAGTPYGPDGPGLLVRCAEALECEVRNRKARGL